MPGRDRRQFKGLPYPQPIVFPPPSAETWEGLGATAPLPLSRVVAPASARRSVARSRATLMAAETPVATSQANDSLRLLKVAQDHGFELVRERPSRVIKRGAMRFNIGNDFEPPNRWSRDRIIEICDSIDRASEKQKPRTLPLAVIYNEVTWAVYAQNAMQWNLQSLDNGHRMWVDKELCTPVSDQQLKEKSKTMTETQPTTLEQAEAAFPHLSFSALPAPLADLPKAELPQVDPRLAELDPMQAWTVSTQRMIDSMQRQIDEAEAKLEPLRERVNILRKALAVTGQATTTTYQPKRTVLPPTRKPGSGSYNKTSGQGEKFYATPEQIAEVRRLWEESTMTVPNIMQQVTQGQSAATNAYAWREKAAKNGNPWKPRPVGAPGMGR